MLVSWYDELARILTKVEDFGVWPDGLLDVEIAMIPTTDGDSASLCAPCCFIVFGLLLVWSSLRISAGGWSQFC